MRRNLWVFVLGLVALNAVLLACTEQGATTLPTAGMGAISGRVMDAGTDEGLSQVKITTEPATQPTTTDGDGRFLIDRISEGTYTLQASRPGYNPGSGTAIVKSQETSKAILVLSVQIEGDAPPQISIVAPPSASTISGETVVLVEAKDDTRVEKVVFSLDGEEILTDKKSPYEWKWDTTESSDGSHSIGARAVDSSKQATAASAVYTVANTKPAAAVAVSEAKGVLGHWSFDEKEGTSATDISGKGHHGILTDIRFGVEGKAGTAYEFNGSSSSVEIPSADDLNMTVFTIDLWVKPGQTGGGQQSLIIKLSGTDKNFYLVRSGEGKLEGGFDLASPGKGEKLCSVKSSRGLNAGVWAHPALVFDGQYATLYLDGNAEQKVSCALPKATAGSTLFGMSSRKTEYFRGVLDEVRIFGRALNAGEIYGTDTTPPDTTITASPLAETFSASAEFKFESTETSSTFTCWLDTKPGEDCVPPKSYPVLTNGAHTFSVAAKDSAGNFDPTAATFKWTISAPETTITSAPVSPSAQTTAEFKFESTDSTAGFLCALDAKTAEDCSSPKSYSGLTAGDHTFTVTARNASKNQDPTPATHKWTVDTTPADTTIDSKPSNPTTATDASFSFSCSDLLAASSASTTTPTTATTTATNSTSLTTPPCTFECKMDLEEYKTCTPPQAYSALADGIRVFSVRALDTAKNTDLTPATYSWTIDTTPPLAPKAGQILILMNPPGTADQIQGLAGAVESGSTVQVYSDGLLTTLLCSATAASDGSFPAVNCGDNATATFHIRVRDAVGNWSTVTTKPNDTTAPAATITSQPSNPSGSSTASFSFDSSEAGNTFECQIDSGAYSSCLPPKTYTALTEGSHTFCVRSKDAAGQSSPAVCFTWSIDLTAPITSITAEPATPTKLTTASFSFESNEAGSTFQCRLDSQAFASCTSPKPYSGLGEGSHTFEVFAVDPSGNADTTVERRTWAIDLTPPNTVISAGPAACTTANLATFTFSASETGGTCYCQLDTGVSMVCVSPITYTNLSEATHTFTVYCQDAVGNVDPTPAGWSWKVDNTAPNTSISSGTYVGNATNSSSASFGLATTEAGATFECRIDGAAFATCTTPKAYTALTAASHTFDVQAKDCAGNTDATPATYTWTIDQTAPTFSAFNVTPNPAKSGSVLTITFDRSETLAANPTVTVSGNAASFTSLATNTYTYSYTVAGTEGEGVKSIAISGSDPAGNNGSGSGTVTLDFTSPTSSAVPAGGTYGAPQNVSLSCAEAGGATQYCTTVGCTPSTAYTVPVNVAGSGVLRHRCSDAAGNVGTTRQENYTIDATAPVFTVITANPQYAKSGSVVTITFTASEALNGNPVIEVAGQLGSYTSNAGLDYTYSYTASANCVNEGQGAKTIVVSGYDATSNYGSSAGGMYIDCTAPETSISAQPSNPSNNASPNFSFGGTDAVSATANLTYECQIDAGGYSGCTSPKNYPGLTDASHTFYVRAKDQATNVDVSPASYTWTVDTTAPDTTISGACPTNPTNSNSASVAFTCSEASTSECRIDGGTYASCSSPNTWNSLTDASHTADIRCKDAATNTDGSPLSCTWTVDTAAPGIPAGLTVTPGSQQCAISWGAVAGVGGATPYKVYYDTNSGTPYSGTGATEGASPVGVAAGTTKTLTGLSNGTNYYTTVTAKDAAGNESGYSTEITCTPQPANANPTVAVTSPNGGETLNGTRYIVWTATDSDTGQTWSSTIRYSPDGGTTWLDLATNVSTTVSATGFGNSFAWNTGPYPNAATYRIRVIVSDGAGSGQDDSNANFTLNNTNAPAGSEYPCDANTPALYHFNETVGTTTTDSCGTNNGTISGATINQAGKIDKAYSYNGSSGYVSVSDSSSLSFGNGSSDTPFSVEAWVKLNSIGATGYSIVTKDTSGQREWGLYTTGARSDGKAGVEFSVNNNSGAYLGRHDNVNGPEGIISAGTWYHIAATYDGSRSNSGIRIYLNGVRVDTTDYSLGSYTAMQDTGTAVNVGRQGSYGFYFNGLIDEVRISNKARTPEEFNVVRENRGTRWAKSAGNPVLTAGASGSWDTRIDAPTVLKDGSTYKMWYSADNYPASPTSYGIGYATSSDGVTWAKHGGNPVFTPSTSGFDASQVGDPRVIKDGSRYLLYYYGAASGSYSIGLATSADGTAWGPSTYTSDANTVALYHFDEAAGTTATDASPNGNNGTITGGALINQSGKFAQAYSLDDVDDYVEIAALTGAPFQGASAWTAEAWINYASSPPNGCSNCGEQFLGKHHTDTTAGFFQFEFKIVRDAAGAGKHRLRGNVGSSGTPSSVTVLDGNTDVPVGVWTHAALVYDPAADTLTMYQNGAVVASGALTAVIQDDPAGAMALQIGRQKFGNSEYFGGLIDEVRISNKARTPGEFNFRRQVLAAGSSGTWDSGGVWPGAVMKDGTTYKMWYVGDASGMQKIGYATSTDGTTWAKYSGNPVFGPASSGWDAASINIASVAKYNGLYHMFYSPNVSVTSLGHASSFDGITWTRFGGNPILTLEGGWESGSPATYGLWSSVVADGEQLKLWYSAWPRMAFGLAYEIPEAFIPAGKFVMGSDAGDTGALAVEQPEHTVHLSPYYMDLFEVTNAAYKACVTAAACTAPASSTSQTRGSYYGNPTYDNYPVVHVTKNQAANFCSWAGKQLPTEAQWEKASRGAQPDERTYPWGETAPDCTLSNASGCPLGDTNSVGSYPNGKSPFGLYDVAGNAWEWVSDWFDSAYYAASPLVNPTGPSTGSLELHRGGGFPDVATALHRVADRNNGQGTSPGGENRDGGFRCARSAAASSGSGAVGPTVDDFNRADGVVGNGWNAYSGTWQIVTNEMCGDGHNGAGSGGTAMQDPSILKQIGHFSTFDVKAKFRINNSLVSPGLFMNAPYHHLMSGVGLKGLGALMVPGSSVLRLHRETTQLASVAATMLTNTDYYIRLKYDGTNLYARIWKTADAEPGTWTVQAAATDTAASQDYIGLGANIGGTTSYRVCSDDLTRLQ